jgi:hypothetical protein
MAVSTSHKSWASFEWSLCDITRILKSFRVFILSHITVQKENRFLLYLIGKMPVPTVSTSLCQSDSSEQNETSDCTSACCVMEHCGSKWVSLSQGSTFARALRSWDGIDGNSYDVFGVTGAEWERPVARAATIWTQEIGQLLSAADFQVWR